MTAAVSSSAETPWHLDIDLSSKCNLRCSFCHLTYFKVKDRTQLSFEDFALHIGPMLPRLKSITLFSKYEPLICRDFIKILFDKIQERAIETLFFYQCDTVIPRQLKINRVPFDVDDGVDNGL